MRNEEMRWDEKRRDENKYWLSVSLVRVKKVRDGVRKNSSEGGLKLSRVKDWEEIELRLYVR